MDDATSMAQVAPHTDDFAQIEYLLKLSLRSSAVQVLSMQVIPTPHLRLQFESVSSALMTVDSWVSTQHLGDLNTLREVVTRGFRFPPSGMAFPVGTISLTPDMQLPANTAGAGVYEFLLCKIGVGRAFAIEESQLLQKPPLPQGFSSYYIHKEMDELDPSSTYYHEYLVPNPSQVLPCYIVRFRYNPSDDEGASGVDVLATANEAAASNAALYEQLDAQATARLVGLCVEHQTQAEYYDPVLKVPVCMHCKVVGSHSVGEAANHPLIPIGQAYKKDLGEATRADALLNDRRKRVQAQLRVIDDTLKKVKANSAAVEDRIYQMMQEALRNLHAVSQHKLSVLLSDELELRRQLQHIEWVESFGLQAARRLQPLDFLRAWSAHTRFRKELQSFGHFRADVDVKPDIALRGTVSVSTDDQATMAAAAAAVSSGAIGQPLSSGSRDLGFGMPYSGPALSSSYSGAGFGAPAATQATTSAPMLPDGSMSPRSATSQPSMGILPSSRFREGFFNASAHGQQEMARAQNILQQHQQQQAQLQQQQQQQQSFDAGLALDSSVRSLPAYSQAGSAPGPNPTIPSFQSLVRSSVSSSLAGTPSSAAAPATSTPANNPFALLAATSAAAPSLGAASYFHADGDEASPYIRRTSSRY